MQHDNGARVSAPAAVAGEHTLWLLTSFREPTPGVVLWTVDID